MTHHRDPILIADVVAIAEALEASAAEVYRQAAAGTTEQRVRDTLLGLAEMEEEHGRAFRELRGQLASPDLQTPVRSQAADLLDAWVGGEVFPPAVEQPAGARQGHGVASWLRTAVGMEKESIAFYSGLREMVEEGQRPVVDQIIGEELYHLASLSYLLRALRPAVPPRARA
jgi:rubrerythrin